MCCALMVISSHACRSQPSQRALAQGAGIQRLASGEQHMYGNKRSMRTRRASTSKGISQETNHHSDSKHKKSSIACPAAKMPVGELRPGGRVTARGLQARTSQRRKLGGATRSTSKRSPRAIDIPGKVRRRKVKEVEVTS